MTKIFLTGVTGLVGSSFVTALLRERKDVEFVCMVRPAYNGKVLPRVEQALREQCDFDGCPEALDQIMQRVSAVGGDVTSMVPEELAKLPELAGVDTVFHCAADVNLGKDPTGKTFNINYNGTVNMLELAKLLKVKAFHYVSTAYVAGKLVGRAMEDVPQDCGFNNPYEESKCKAEMLVRQSGFPFTIYRPAIITGRRSDGRIRKPLAFYRILEFLAKMKKHHCNQTHQDPADVVDMAIHFLAVPSEHVYFVPIDYVQELITALFQKPVCNRTYHVTGASPVTTIQIDQAMCDFLRMEGVRVDAENTDPNVDDKLMTRFLGDLLPYFASDIEFDQTNVVAALGPQVIDWPYGMAGLQRLMRSYYADFYPDVEWLQRLVAIYDEKLASEK
ncbi:MAG: SDR family oxidoreductase [Victivallaceae bacterium]|nr:SDR family oxidoreductase [Victivallaceae bacterium]